MNSAIHIHVLEARQVVVYLRAEADIGRGLGHGKGQRLCAELHTAVIRAMRAIEEHALPVDAIYDRGLVRRRSRRC